MGAVSLLAASVRLSSRKRSQSRASERACLGPRRGGEAAHGRPQLLRAESVPAADECNVQLVHVVPSRVEPAERRRGVGQWRRPGGPRRQPLLSAQTARARSSTRCSSAQPSTSAPRHRVRPAPARTTASPPHRQLHLKWPPSSPHDLLPARLGLERPLDTLTDRSMPSTLRPLGTTTRTGRRRRSTGASSRSSPASHGASAACTS